MQRSGREKGGGSQKEEEGEGEEERGEKDGQKIYALKYHRISKMPKYQ